MSTPKHHRAKQNLFRQLWNLNSTIFKWLIGWFLRALLVTGRKPRFAKSGFVLPTTALLLVFLALVVGALVFRSFSRTSQVIAEREQKVVYNAATPAIDRAKSKIEYIFKKDTRLPSGVPGSGYLASMLLNNGKNGVPKYPNDTSPEDLYSLPDEKRLDINNDSVLDNAWVFPVNKDGKIDGTIATVYSILLETEGVIKDKTGKETSVTINNSTDVEKASQLVVRNVPYSGIAPSSNCNFANRSLESGWYPIDNTSLRKNFQVDAFVINNNPVTRTVATLELQQERKVDKGNKWAAWFRNDLEVFPGPTFNMNGAMHTEGNLIAGNDSKFTSYLISAPQSCFYTQDGSEISVAKSDTFEGQIVAGRMNINSFADSKSIYHFFNGIGKAPIKSPNTELNTDTDSVVEKKGQSPDVENISLDPIALFTQNKSQPRNTTTWERDSKWVERDFVKKARIYNNSSPQPYIDDTYRADNRYGPKPKYSDAKPVPGKIGEEITNADDLKLLADDNPPGESDAFGLDGYWERRARGDGLRIIVGQRLELGNSVGWNGNDDPLYPSSSTSISNERRQWRTLRDNPAAVQASAIYHYENADGYFPLACVATTAHPGTNGTVANSTDFRLRNFFIGRGTNGWEYAPPATDETTFASNIASGKPLGNTLRNLAYFAGDPDGAFPPKQETSGSIVHPYPNLTMWGDFSNLRRVIKKLDVDSIKYADLSIADKTYLQTAGCSMGMLAQNIKDANDTTATFIADGKNVVSLGEHIWQGFVGKGSGTTDLSQTFCDATTKKCKIPAPELLLAGLKDDEKQQLLSFNTSRQIARDRKYGFLSPAMSAKPFSFKDGSKDFIFDFSPECNPSETSYVFDAAFKGAGSGLDPKKAGMSMVCEVVTKYPSLYYLFPTVDHDHKGKDDHIQPVGESYIKDTYISNSSSGVNRAVTYKALTDADISSMAIAPRDTSNWKLPKTTTANTVTATQNPITTPSGTTLYVPFLDTGISNGREMMGVRLLNIDLDLLRQNVVDKDTLIPVVDGIVYAFREDAVREDGIARPASTTKWDDYVADPTTYGMKLKSGTQDPPLYSNGISPKPVDYYADPDRRPHGFRLRNGVLLKRANYTKTADGSSGMTFVTDNPVYIQGDFNHHNLASNTSTRLEEFDIQLDTDWSKNFYTRGKPKAPATEAIDERFATIKDDNWRPTEILADAITILSKNFVDGSIEDMFNAPASTTSYRNFNRPKPGGGVTIGYWIREDASQESQSPIKIDQDGFADYCTNASDPQPCETANTRKYDGVDNAGKSNDEKFVQFSDTKDRITAAETRVNSILVSGLVPSRANQSYGGIHNFPRFIENWKDSTNNSINLHIAGSFLQLNFSVYADAPFDHDAWESGASPVGSDKTSHEYIGYYAPPDRRWGYDIGLQYAPAGPAARRFVSPGNTRTEFYRELPIEDAYIKNLRCAKFDSKQIDPNAQGCS